mmetsp:Transcript_59161/g.80822  ORF Transcript_59161/g.80822 Transcript_59161/m.80822 type:complete len:96 (-) Transcript_59161:49-336(-)
MFYVFTSLIEIHADTNVPLGIQTPLLETLVSMSLAVVGLLYMLMGMLCMKHFKEEGLVLHNHRRNRRTHTTMSEETKSSATLSSVNDGFSHQSCW